MTPITACLLDLGQCPVQMKRYYRVTTCVGVLWRQPWNRCDTVAQPHISQVSESKASTYVHLCSPLFYIFVFPPSFSLPFLSPHLMPLMLTPAHPSTSFSHFPPPHSAFPSLLSLSITFFISPPPAHTSYHTPTSFLLQPPTLSSSHYWFLAHRGCETVSTDYTVKL